jgi:6-phosphogluconolactonase
MFLPGANAHQVRASASGTSVYVPCLGADRVARYDLDVVAGTLVGASAADLPPGSGPRHLDFHPTANVVYVLAELSSELYVFDVGGSGELVARPGATVFTHDDGQYHQSSDVKVTPSGAYVFAVNRQSPEIVGFRVELDFSVTKLGSDALTGAVRSFAMDPAGSYLQVGGDDGRLAALRIDAATGALAETSAQTGLGNIRSTEIRYLR